jgi:hypothetical protein
MHASEIYACKVYAYCYGSVKMILFSYSSITGKSQWAGTRLRARRNYLGRGLFVCSG